MNQPKHNDKARLNYYYGLAVDEIKLERSINKMSKTLNNPYYANRPHDLIDKISDQERQLLSIRKLRSAR